jgi:cytoskeletal protein CcmA (bactofilin family)
MHVRPVPLFPDLEETLFRRSRKPEPDTIEVIIGPRATFSGTLRCDTSIRIDGVVESGFIETPSNVILTENAHVFCDITARVISIRGKYRGTIQADRVELLDGCHVQGSLYVNSFLLDEGALLDGELHMQGTVGLEDPGLPPPNSFNTIPVVQDIPTRSQDSS